MSQLVTHTVADGIAHVRLARPEKLNALTLQTLDELVATARELRKDRTLRAVILSGEGPSFCAGLDFGSVLKKPAGIVGAFLPRPWRGTNIFQEACWAWRRLPVPVIAAVHGHCYGGGLQIALAADFRIATPDSEWSVLEGQLGDHPGHDRGPVARRAGRHRHRQAADHDRADVLGQGGRTTSAWSPSSPPTRWLPPRTSPASWRPAPPTSSRPRSGCSTTRGPRRRRRTFARERVEQLFLLVQRQHQGRPRGRAAEGDSAVRTPQEPLNHPR